MEHNNMKGLVDNIEKLAEENHNFRKVLYTSEYSQLVLMSLKPSEEIGMEVHKHTDQFLRVEKGQGKAILDGQEHVISDGSAVLVPRGTQHNVVNTSTTKDLKLYTIYAPPHHRDGVIHQTRKDAMNDHEHFGGKTTE